jgi:hypothetical protein
LDTLRRLAAAHQGATLEALLVVDPATLLWSGAANTEEIDRWLARE